MIRVLYIVLISFVLSFISCVYANTNQPHEKSTVVSKQAQNTTNKNDGLINISPEGQKVAGIKTEILQPRELPVYITAPGEVIPNTDLTFIVTPRVQAQILSRLVKVGDHVKKGAPLARLSSVEMAKAQANLLLSHKEWMRVKWLGKQAVSAKRYQTAEAAYQQAYSRLLAYAMTNSQIKDFIKRDDLNKANGDFTLTAGRSGTIFSSNFTEGQMVEPGRVLYKIVDEKSLWVDARLSNGESASIKKNSHAVIQTAHSELPAKVLQVHHKLDEATRTRVIRLEVSNKLDQLHPGEFVTCLIQAGKTQSALAVNKAALVRTSDGDMAIYVEVRPNYFKEKEIEVVKKVGAWRAIKGLNPGVRIVSEGAFFVRSEGLKSGFKTHNH